MHAGRTAMLTLLSCILVAPATHCLPSIEPPANRKLAVTAYPAQSSVGWLSSRPPQATKFVQIVRWKARPKIVLGETDQKVVEEVDLGPALSLTRPVSFVPIASASCRVPPTSRLRC